MDVPSPLETLFDAGGGDQISLPDVLAEAYGAFRLPHDATTHVIANFVGSLDGVVALNEPGRRGGGAEIAGPDPHDHMVMGLLRAIADVIIVGAGTLRDAPGHIWTAQQIYPPFADAYGQLRRSLGKKSEPLNVIVTRDGGIDLQQRLFLSGSVPVAIIAAPEGARRLREQASELSVDLLVPEEGETMTVRWMLRKLRQREPTRIILTEGGPRLLADFLAEGCLDELFLTLAPQIAGRDGSTERPGLVAGRRFAPEAPLWGVLAGVKRSGSHLFLRYAFPS